MPLIRECRFTAIDFESAGAERGRTDAPVQVGLASWSHASGHHDAFVSYLHTDQPVQWSARKVHGIGPEDLAGAWAFARSETGDPICTTDLSPTPRQ